MDLTNPYRAAALMIERHAVDAQSVAYDLACGAEVAGDGATFRQWMDVFDAILELKAVRRLNGGAVH